MLTRMMIWMERERERGHPLHVVRAIRHVLSARKSYSTITVYAEGDKDSFPSFRLVSGQ
jgi:hypothetical protein